jgi:prevent-host-death family protein
MTQVSLEEFRKHLDRYLAETGQGDVVLTQDGKPWLVLRSIADDQDRLSAAYASSPEFWEMIRQRRQERGIPWEQAKQLLDLPTN